jgi:flagellar motor switch protein FliN/FliY
LGAGADAWTDTGADEDAFANARGRAVANEAPRSSLERAFERAEFAPFGDRQRQGSHSNIDLLLDVPLPVTVELGRTSMTIRDILDLAPGSVVELDRVAGEPVDILVNGKLVARGEVVVIDENFGVRVVDIIAPAERLSGTKA